MFFYSIVFEIQDDVKMILSYSLKKAMPSTVVNCKYSRILNYGLRMPKNYHSVLLDLFATDIKAYAADRYNMSRNHYQTIAQRLHEAKRLSGGAMTVSRIVEEFRTTYKRRSAMMEELRGL